MKYLLLLFENDQSLKVQMNVVLNIEIDFKGLMV